MGTCTTKSKPSKIPSQRLSFFHQVLSVNGVTIQADQTAQKQQQKPVMLIVNLKKILVKRQLLLSTGRLKKNSFVDEDFDRKVILKDIRVSSIWQRRKVSQDTATDTIVAGAATLSHISQQYHMTKLSQENNMSQSGTGNTMTTAATSMNAPTLNYLPGCGRQKRISAFQQSTKSLQSIY